MRNKKKIVRAVTVSNSIDFFKEVMVKQKADGYETVVVTSPGHFMDEFRAECPDFKTIEVPMERHISLIKDMTALAKMIWVFLKERPYVVHSMTPKAGLLSMIAGKLTGVPIRIHTFTGLVWPTSTGLKRKILMVTDKILCESATHIIPEGEGVKSDLQNHITNKPMKVLGYGNVMGVDMERFNPKRFKSEVLEKDVSLNFKHKNLTSEKEKPFVFLFVGRVVGDKGINELVTAFVRLNKIYPDTLLKLIGDYERNLDPLLPETNNAIERNYAIEANGSCYGDELLKEYVNSDCFVMPSYREGFPNSVLEAGAMGLSQIVTDINGSREIVCGFLKSQNNRTTELASSKIKICKNGIIVPPKDADSLFEAMELILTNGKLRNEMASNAREMIESRFEKNYVQNCQIEFYNELLKDK